jgi:hypothetical protein
MHAGVHRKRLSAKYRQLGQDGFVSAHEYLPGLEPGTVDRQHSKATGMLACLCGLTSFLLAYFWLSHFCWPDGVASSALQFALHTPNLVVLP